MFLREKKRGKTRCSLLSRSRGVERVFESERVYLSLSPCAPRYRPHPLCLRGKLEKTSLHFSQKNIKKILEEEEEQEEEEEEEEEIRRYNILKHTDRPRDHFFSLSLVLSHSICARSRALGNHSSRRCSASRSSPPTASRRVLVFRVKTRARLLLLRRIIDALCCSNSSNRRQEERVLIRGAF